MLLIGSNGPTKKQLEEALGTVKDEKLLSNLKKLNNVLTYNSKGLQVKLANSVFPSEEFEVAADYKRDMESAFKSRI